MNLRTLIRNWLRSAVSFSRARFRETGTDQSLLFTGGGCRCFFNTKHAYLVSVRLNGKRIGCYPPKGSVHLFVPEVFRLSLRACGVFGGAQKQIELPVYPLFIRPAPYGRLLKAEPVFCPKTKWAPKKPRPQPVAISLVIDPEALTIRNTTLTASRMALETALLRNNFENNTP